MAIKDDTEMGGSRGRFPTTHWSQLAAVGGSVGVEHRAVLNLIIERYWKPVYCYIRRRGWDNEQAKDLVQEFFTTWLQRNLFGQADPARGRFRAFLLSSLDNFLSNVRHAARAKKRHPQKGFLSIHELATDSQFAFEPADQGTPEAVFDRMWVSELLVRTLTAFEKECRATGKDAHYELFRRRVIEPALEGADLPSVRELGTGLGLTEKEAGNRLITARRAFQRLLREEIRVFASSEEEVAAEIQDLFHFVAKP